MSNQIQLEYGQCPKCKLQVDNWTVKAEVVNGVLGVRCPSCREVVKLKVKEETAEAEPESETSTSTLTEE